MGISRLKKGSNGSVVGCDTEEEIGKLKDGSGGAE